MIIFLLFGVAIGTLSIIFALQNSVVVTVSLLFWHFTGSLTIIILLAVLVGVVVCALLSIPGTLRTFFRHASLKKQKADLEKNLADAKARVSELEHKLVYTDPAPPVSTL